MPGYWIRQLSTPVQGSKPHLVTLFKSRAQRRRDKLNRELKDALVDMYRYEVYKRGRRWIVMPMQNVKIPAPRLREYP